MSVVPSDHPTSTPSLSLEPSSGPSSDPSSEPSSKPSSSPSISNSPSSSPSIQPSESIGPSSVPTSEPSSSPSECVDEPDWVLGGTTLYASISCDDIKSQDSSTTSSWCDFLDSHYNATVGGKTASEACCDCGGGDHHTPSPSSSPSSNPSTSQAPSHEFFPSASPTSQPSECLDEPGWTFTDDSGQTLGCDALATNPGKLCFAVESVFFESKPASLACCVSLFYCSLFTLIFIF